MYRLHLYKYVGLVYPHDVAMPRGKKNQWKLYNFFYSNEVKLELNNAKNLFKLTLKQNQF